VPSGMEHLLHCHRLTLGWSPVIAAYDNIAVDFYKFDEWSRMSHPEKNSICDLEEVTSAMASPSENMYGTSTMAVPPLDNFTSYLSRSIFEYLLE